MHTVQQENLQAFSNKILLVTRKYLNFMISTFDRQQNMAIRQHPCPSLAKKGQTEKLSCAGVVHEYVANFTLNRC